MDAVRPALVGVAVTFLTVVVVLQHALGDEVAGGGSGQRREEVLFARLGTGDVPAARVLRMETEHHHGEHAGHDRPARPHLPLDPPARQSVEHEEPGGEERRDDMDPVGDRARRRVLDHDHALDPGEDHARRQQQESRGEQGVAGPHRAPVRTVVGVADVEGPEKNHRQDDGQAEGQVA